MKQYLDILEHTLNKGIEKMDRTGTGTLSTFGYQTRYNLEKGFPLLTTKELHIKSIVYELFWYLSGSTSIDYLKNNGVRIWNEWADENNEVGKLYGYQWRSWESVKNGEDGLELIKIDQLQNTIDSIRSDPHSRRLVISAWNVGNLDEMNLPPCHAFLQFYTDNRQRLSLQLYQRSMDIFLGAGFNIACYSLLLSMVAQCCGLKPYEFIHTVGDMHLYLDHVDKAKMQLKRKPRKLPTLILNPNITEIDDFKPSDIRFSNYNPHPKIEAKVSV